MRLTTHQREFLERFVAEGKTVGLSRSISLVMGYLLICKPGQQSAEQLQNQLGLSAGSVSGAISMLVKLQALERSRKPGDKRYYYEFLPEGFERAVEVRIHATRRYAQLAEFGLGHDKDNSRLRAMRDTYKILDKATVQALREMQRTSL